MDILKSYQQTLFPYAYNILGSTDDARDVVQDVIVGHIGRDGDDIKNESAYLIKSVVNKSINLKNRNKKMQRQTTWLPEPIATDRADNKINRQEIISYAMMVMLEHLNPKERAVFILKEAFDYSHEEIAQLFSFSVENSRKLLSRAKNTLKKKGLDLAPKDVPQIDFLSEYVDVVQKGDVKLLEQMLSDQITAQTDGGGKIKVLSEFMVGIDAVANFAIKVYEMYLKDYQIKIGELNRTPALLFYQEDTLVNCQLFSLDGATGKISNIYSVVDPEKLKNLKKD